LTHGADEILIFVPYGFLDAFIDLKEIAENEQTPFPALPVCSLPRELDGRFRSESAGSARSSEGILPPGNIFDTWAPRPPRQKVPREQPRPSSRRARSFASAAVVDRRFTDALAQRVLERTRRPARPSSFIRQRPRYAISS
jgi:hypothetical protein